MTTRKFPPAVSRSSTAERQVLVTPRRYPRVAVVLAAHFALGGESEWSPCTIDDLGGGGVRLQTEQDLAAGTVMFLRFTIEGTLITVTARIVMSFFDKARARYVHGAAFTAIDPAMRERVVARVCTLQDECIGA